MKITKVVEWKPIYIDLNLMEMLLQPYSLINHFNQDKKKSVNKVQTSSFAYNSMLVQDINCLNELEQLNEKIVERLCRDMNKCDQFYNLHQQQIQVKLRKLIYNIFIYQDLQKIENIKSKLYILKQYSEMLYLECNLLEQFAQFNEIVIKKVLKKYKKQVFIQDPYYNLQKMQSVYNELQIFNNRQDIQKIQVKLKLLYSRCLSSKQQNKNIRKLKYHNIYKGFTRKEQLLIGLYLGGTFCLFIYIISKRNQLNNNFYKNQFYYDLYFPMFRGIGLMILYYWSLIFCVYCWIKGNVGYRSIFNFQYHSSSINQLIKRAALITLLYFTVLIISLQKELYLEEENDKKQYLLDYITDKIAYDPAIGPLVLWIIMMLYMIWPSKKYLNAKGRKYFWKIVYTSILAGFFDCPFVNGWSTDQLLSLVLMLKDFGYTVCFYIKYFQNISDYQSQATCGDPKNLQIGLIVCLIPIFLRFVQLGRCFYDAGKITKDDIFVVLIYVEVTMVNVFSYLSQFGNSYFIVWIISFCTLACHAYFWDVKKDWGLFQINSNHKHLRNQLAFKPIFYYIAIVFEFFLRFAWILSISPNMASIIHIWSPLFSLIMAILELCRRTVWNIFRIENVHIQNMGDFKAVYPIQLPFESLIDQQSYVNIKELRKTQIDPINISLLSGTQNQQSVSGQYFQFRNSLRSDSLEDESKLNQLQQQEQDLIAETMFEDRKRESILTMRYSQFKIDHQNEKQTLSKQELLRDLSIIQEMIKKMN
ncbi:unnamed protein product [Paramecium primaurelia]|uniref:EXS domain-containing protein n=1 Tax=Paramecium primaurelia TaxID=5886 RepID=A0A8S1NNG2_PARPR|nr:unnamed protein product [Paramecium primaurelia]